MSDERLPKYNGDSSAILTKLNLQIQELYKSHMYIILFFMHSVTCQHCDNKCN